MSNPFFVGMSGAWTAGVQDEASVAAWATYNAMTAFLPASYRFFEDHDELLDTALSLEVCLQCRE